MDTDGALSAAIAHHRRGDAAEAEEICREILQSDPADVRALRFLAMLSSQRGDAGSAIGLFRRAIDRAPEDPDLHLQLGRVALRFGTRGGSGGKLSAGNRDRPRAAGRACGSRQ